MGLIEDNEINNNTLAGVWITTGKFGLVCVQGRKVKHLSIVSKLACFSFFVFLFC